MQISNISGTVTINGRSFSGRNVSIVNNQVIVDGVAQKMDLPPVINVVVNGDCSDIDNHAGDITIKGSAASVKTGSGNIQCGNVNGNVKAGSGNIRCSNISGSATTGSGNIYTK